MKQIFRLKRTLLALTLLASFIALPGGVIAPQKALAAGCNANPTTDTQATAQIECVKKYISACKKTYDKAFCNTLSVSEINKCAQDTAEPKFKNACMRDLEEAYQAANVPSTTGIPAAPKDCTDTELSSSNCGIIKMIITITNIIAGLAGLVIVGTLIWGGILYSSAGSDPSKVQAAKNKVVAAITALLLLVFGYAIVQWLVPGGIL